MAVYVGVNMSVFLYMCIYVYIYVCTFVHSIVVVVPLSFFITVSNALLSIPIPSPEEITSHLWAKCNILLLFYLLTTIYLSVLKQFLVKQAVAKCHND